MVYAQNDDIQKERYEVINTLFKNGDLTLDKHFFQFLGIGALISDSNLIDNQLGHCFNIDKKESYAFSDIISSEEISKMYKQISGFSYYRTLDSTMLSNNIIIVDDKENTKSAITLPLIYNDKAIIYMTNKNNEEQLFVLVKENDEWTIRCRKNIYLRFDD